MAVDWFLFGERVATVIGDLIALSIVALVAICVIGIAVDGLHRHGRARHMRVTDHPTSNVVRLVPRNQPFDWSADGDAS